MLICPWPCSTIIYQVMTLWFPSTKPSLCFDWYPEKTGSPVANALFTSLKWYKMSFSFHGNIERVQCISFNKIKPKIYIMYLTSTTGFLHIRSKARTRHELLLKILTAYKKLLWYIYVYTIYFVISLLCTKIKMFHMNFVTALSVS